MKPLTTVSFLVCSLLVNSQEWISLGGGANNQVREIYVDTISQKLFAVGAFQDIGGSGGYRVAEWDGTNWVSLCDPPYLLDTNPILSVVKYNNELLVSGTHGIMGDSLTLELSRHVAGTTWEKFDDIDGVALFEVIEDKLIAIGSFDSIGTEPIKNVGVWDGNAWSVIGDTSVSNYFDVQSLADIEIYNGNYVIGGNAESPKEIFQWDGLNWSTLGSGIPGSSAWVNCLKSYQGVLYIGGNFNDPNFPSEYLVAWDGQNFFDPFPNVNFRGQVSDLKVINNELYILGGLSIDGSLTTYGFSKFDGDSLCTFGGAGIWGQTPVPGAQKIVEYQGEIIVATGILMGEDTVNFIGKWNGVAMDTCIYNPVNVGVKENDSKTISVYPNPVAGILRIGGSELKNINEITVLSMTGEVIMKSRLIENTIDISDLNSGIYILMVNGTHLRIVKE